MESKVHFEDPNNNVGNEDVFSLFEYYANAQGQLQVSAVGNILRVLGLNPTVAEVQKCELAFGPVQVINFQQFAPVFKAMAKVESKYSADDFVEGLRQFDRDGNGCIRMFELRHLLSNLGEKLSSKELDSILIGLEDADGYVDCQKLVDTVLEY